MILNGLEPAAPLFWFEKLCSIPHGSGNTKEISDFCVDFARERGLECYQDEANNVIIKKPGTSGYEASAPVILQGHLDMVCQKKPGCDIDFLHDGLRLKTDGEYVWADGTTLGGDDGIAVAMTLAVLDSDSISHPPIEAVFTVDEETGMLGAAVLDMARLSGRRMINIDSEVEGVFTVSCAGGLRADVRIPVSREMLITSSAKIVISGLRGGHSGVEIGKNRASSNALAGRVLDAVIEKCGAQLVSLSGGSADNAIAAHSEMVVALCEKDLPLLESAVSELNGAFRNEYAVSDPDISVCVAEVSSGEVSALCTADTRKVCDALLILPQGIQAMSQDMPGLVETSLNLGILTLENDYLRAAFSVRSSVSSRKKMIARRLERIAAILGGSIEYSGDYPAWEFKRGSGLCQTLEEIYLEQYGSKPDVVAIHAGLECGLFSAALPGLECVSIGPNLFDIHTVSERMEIASVLRVWNFLLKALERMK